MKKTLFLLAIIFVFFSSIVIAQETQPEEYIIKKGDTLWDITGEKFGDEFLWPNLWRANPQIENPDLIYPGDLIRIPSREELLRLPYVPEEKPAVAAVEEEKPEVVVPVKIPKQYILNKSLYLSSGWIAPELPGIGKIFSAPTKRVVFGKNDFVYLESAQNISIDDMFFVIRNIKKVHHPKTRKFIGHQIRIVGILKVMGMDGENFDVPKAKIASSFENIHTGDSIIPYIEIEPPVIPDVIRAPAIVGYIVESHMNDKVVSRGDIVYLDKGNSDGITVGDTFSALYQMPVERSIGKIQIISSQPTTAAALILKSEEEITVGDMWGNRLKFKD
jgi:hypothetical protein